MSNFKKQVEGRKVALYALVGSHNYNLQEEGSDKDYKVFVLPSFDDLYSGDRFKYSEVGQEVDFEAHDVRKLVNLLWKSNPSYMELLFSKEGGTYCQDLLFLKENAEELARMNLQYYYDSTMGFAMQRRKNVMNNKYTPGTKHLYDAHGYNTKDFMHGLRYTELAMNYADAGFCDYKSALRYSGAERDRMLSFKNGALSKDDAVAFLEEKERLFEDQYKDVFKSKEPNYKLLEKLERVVKRAVSLSF